MPTVVDYVDKAQKDGDWYDIHDTTLRNTKGQANGLATLDSTGKIPSSQLPDIPTGQVQSDWSQADNTKVDYIKNKPGDATTSASGFMSSIDKAKLDGIATGAEVNQNAFAKIKIGSSTVEADAKQDTLELVAGSNITLTPDTTDDTVTIDATDTTYESKTAASGGTDVSLVTTGEKYTWNNKSDFSGAYADLSGKPTLGTAAAKNVTDNYSSTGTDVTTGKAVAAALATLDVTGASSIAASKTISAWSETDGKVSISTQDISITKSQVSDFPTLGTAAAKNYTTSVTQNSTDLVTSGAVWTAIDNLPEPMIMKGTLGTNGTITSLPTAAASNEGFVYKVITAGTYASQAAKVGDFFVSCKPTGASAYSWIWFPSGDESFTDTWRNIKVNGTEKLSTAISSGAVDFVNGTNTTVEFNATGNKISVNVPAVSSTSAGVAPKGAAVSTQSQATKFLREDGSWAAPSYTTNTDRYVNSASFAHDSTNNNVKMTLTRAGSDTTTVTGNIPKVSSSSAGVAPKGAAVSSQSQSTKFLREDGSWAAPSYTTNTNTTYSLTQDSSDGHKITLTPSSGTAQTITIPDNNNAVTQTATSTSANYEVLFSVTADNTTRTEGARKNSNLLFNPGTGVLFNGYYGSAPSVTSRITNINHSTNPGPGTGRTAMRLDLVTTAVTTGQPPEAASEKGSAGYLHTYYWDSTQMNGASQMYIPNGDHMSTRNGPQPIMIRGNDQGTWTDWFKMGMFNSTITSGQVVVTDGAFGIIKSSGYTIAKSVPSDAVFTDAKVTQTATTTNANYEVLFSVTGDNTTRTEGARKNNNLLFNPSTGNLQATQLNGVTIGSSPKFTDNNTTYTFANGTNGFTVTPSGGSAQTVTVTPSITNNVTGSGTSGYIAKFNGTNTITNGPAFGTATTTYLRNDGSWATPTDTKNTAGSTDTSAKIFLIGATSQAANPQTYSDDQVYAQNGTLTANNAQAVVLAVSGSNNGGISLHSGTSNVEIYGIMFRQTSSKGKHGYVQGDWSTYFNMDGTSGRGWTFKNSSVGNVASVSNVGHAVFNGSVTIGGNATNTSGARMEFNSANKCIDFVFN